MNNIPVDKPPGRVVSLVPSMTESLCQLGFGFSLVGITDYCDYPAMVGREIIRVGGTKTPDVGKILALGPDLVIANREENPRPVVEYLQAQGVAVWVTFPRTVQQVINDLWMLVDLFRQESASLRLKTLEKVVELSEKSLIDIKPARYFCPIWREIRKNGEVTWMTFNADTYSNDILRLSGGENVFGRLGLPDNYVNNFEGTEIVRYPWVTSQDIINSIPEVILLPDEPYKFSESDARELTGLFSDKSPVIYLVNGRTITWHGVRIGMSLSELPEYLRNEV